MKSIFLAICSVVCTISLFSQETNFREARKLTENPFHKITSVTPRDKNIIITTNDGLSWIVSDKIDCEIVRSAFKEGDLLTSYESLNPFKKNCWHYNHETNLYFYSSKPRESNPGSSQTRIQSIDRENLVFILQVEEGRALKYQVLVTSTSSEKERERILAEALKSVEGWNVDDPIALLANRSLSSPSKGSLWRLYNTKTQNSLAVELVEKL